MITFFENKYLKFTVTCFLLLFLGGAFVGFILVNTALFQAKVLKLTSVELVKAKYSYPPLKRASLTNMKPYFDTVTEMDTVVQWIDEGALRKPFYQEVYPILERRCITCHGAGMNRADVSLVDWADIYELSVEKGVPYRKLVNQTHIHLFGIGGLILVLTLFFGLSQYRRPWKTLLILLPYAALALDISGWWLAKGNVLFAYQIWISGIVLYTSMGLMAVLTLYALWKK